MGGLEQWFAERGTSTLCWRSYRSSRIVKELLRWPERLQTLSRNARLPEFLRSVLATQSTHISHSFGSRKPISRCVIGRCCSGWRYRPFSGLKNSVRIVKDGRSHHNRPNRSVPPDFLLIQHCGVSSGATLCKSNRFIPSSGIARYLAMLFTVGFLPK